MNTAEVIEWAETHGSGVVAKQDRKNGITSKLVRFTWDRLPTVALGAEEEGKARIDMVLDGLAWQRAHHPGATELRLVVAVDRALRESNALIEHLGAMGTIACSVVGGPTIRLFVLDETGVTERALTPANFTSGKPGEWAKLLTTAAGASPPSTALQLAEAVGHPAFAIYPKLSTAGRVWQLRLDGLEVGTATSRSIALRLNTKKSAAKGEPRDTWTSVVGAPSKNVTEIGTDAAAAVLHQLILAWAKIEASPLRHGHPEHALEAWILNGRLQLRSDGLILEPADVEGRVMRSAQFPTLWADVTSPRRYLDALLRDEKGRPWAVELKDQYASSSHGAYLRDGIGQALLYRHYIRSCSALDPYFVGLGLERTACQAALAYPTPKPRTEKIIASHHEIAAMCDAAIIEFPYPGGWSG